MGDVVASRPAASGVRFYLTAAAAVLPMAFSIVVINYWIYHARWQFSLLHPEYVARQPPTISRAISDPSIGEPFAFWIGVCAVLVFIGVIPVSRLYWLAGRGLPDTGRGTRRFLLLAGPALLLFQATASVGMVLLSSYRFPDHDGAHMVGSYVFFIADSLTVLLAGSVCWRISRDPQAVAHLRLQTSIDPRISRFRAPFAIGAVGFAVLYLILFMLKNVDLPFGEKALYDAYVLTEPLLITYFLTVFASYFWEIIQSVRFSGRAPGRPAAASRTPD